MLLRVVFYFDLDRIELVYRVFSGLILFFGLVFIRLKLLLFHNEVEDDEVNVLAIMTKVL